MFEKSFRPLPEPVVEISVGANVFLTLKIIIIFFSSGIFASCEHQGRVCMAQTGK